MKTFNNLKLKIKNFSKGFTLVELLIVIAIIGVLSALLMANFIGVRQRARDAQRKANLRQIQSALELYRSDNDNYPLTASLANCNVPLTANSVTYMSKIPCDPSGSSIKYTYTSDGTTYSLIACLENSSDLQADRNPDGSLKIDTSCSGKPASFTLNNP